MKTVVRYNQDIEENFDEELGMGNVEFEVEEDKTLKELLFLMMDVNQDYVDEVYDGNCGECWIGELVEDEVYVFGVGVDDFNISPFIDEDTDLDIKIKDLEDLVG